jgi:hypothetical protein
MAARAHCALPCNCHVRTEEAAMKTIDLALASARTG